ncbi:MAG: transporter [Magnetococcales bacterium]|nr:transporter [Magnetococcales bacterium]
MSRLPAVVVLALLTLLWPPELQAIDARLLPPGVLRLRLYQSWITGDERYDASGGKHSLGQTGLDQLAGRGVPESVSNVYAIRNQARHTMQRTDLVLDFGLDPEVDLGLWVPFLTSDLDQSAQLTQATGWSALSTARRTAIAAGVGRLDLADADRQGLGDILVGVKARVLGDRQATHRLALGGGVRLPTGHGADPLDTRDVATGDKQWDLTFWTWYDYQPFENFFINLHTHHEYALPGERAALWPADTTRAADLKFQPGFQTDVQLEPQWRHPLDRAELQTSLFLIYNRVEPEKQQGFDSAQSTYAGARHPVGGTEWQRLMVKPTIGLNLLPMGLPMALYLGYGTTVWGKNTLDLDVMELRFELFLDPFESRSRTGS